MLGGRKITLVAAMARNGAIGLDGAMPWHLPRELKHFKSVTMGHPIVMGRKTWESIGRPLPGRQNIVVTRNPDYRAEGCDVVASLHSAVKAAKGEEVMVIGGGELYRQAMPNADRMLLTRIECDPPADTWFPEWDPADWTEVSAREEEPDEANPHAYRVIDLVRTTPVGGA